jgi:hypothetical protein
METNVLKNSTKVVRPASILLKNKDSYVCSTGTKGIINWTFSTSTKTALDHAILNNESINPNIKQQHHQPTYLSFNDSNNESFENEVNFILIHT